jgi:hypothetical protein
VQGLVVMSLMDQINRAAYLGDIRTVAGRHLDDPRFRLPVDLEALSTKQLSSLRDRLVRLEASGAGGRS